MDRRTDEHIGCPPKPFSFGSRNDYFIYNQVCLFEINPIFLKKLLRGKHVGGILLFHLNSDHLNAQIKVVPTPRSPTTLIILFWLKGYIISIWLKVIQ